MKELLIFVLLGLLVAAPGEVLNQILARHNVQAFRSTMISYTVLLLIGYFVGEGISSVCKKSRSRLIYYLLFGFLGLMVEWFLLGNAPVLEPFQIITQPGMFTYWGTMLLAEIFVTIQVVGRASRLPERRPTRGTQQRGRDAPFGRRDARPTT